MKPFLHVGFTIGLGMGVSGAPLIRSDFSSNDDDWRAARIFAADSFTSFDHFFTPPFSPPYGPFEGNPGGTISVQDIDGDASAEFSAPAKFLGNKIDYYGGAFSWDYRSTGGTVPVDPTYDLVLVGGGLVLLSDVGFSPPSDVWVRRTATLAESAGWHVGSLTGRVPTRAEFLSVLGNLQGVFIESDLAGGGDTGFLDNVEMSEAPAIPAALIITLEGDTRSLARIQVSGSIGATYQIQHAASSAATSWTTLTNLALATSPSVILDPISVGTGTRFYRAVAAP